MDTIYHQGFIVKRFLPNEQKVSVLTLSYGKNSLFIKDPLLCNRLYPGMVITYVLFKKNGSSHEVTNLEIVELFKNTSFQDTIWIHHILELCYFFCPLNNPCDEIFLFLTQYFYFFNNIAILLTNRLPFYTVSLVKLLTLFDFQPKPLLTHFEDIFESLVAYSIDIDKPQNLESIIECLQAIPEKTLLQARLWGAECIKKHPCFASFKTVDILR